MSAQRDQLVDAGFADANVARMLVRRLRVRAAVGDVRSQVETLLNLMRKQAESLTSDNSAGLPEGFGLHRGYLKDDADIVAAMAKAERNALREDELLKGIELILQLLDQVDIGIRHGLFSGLSEQEVSQVANGAHRLCGGAK